AAAHEQSTTFDVDRADRIAEQHDREDEPRRCRPDRIFDDAADVIDRARQVAEHHRGSAPVGDERERDAPHDDHAGGLGPAGWRGALRCSAHENSGNVKRKKGADMGVPFQYATVHRGTPTRLAGGLELESALTLRPAPRKSPALLGDGASNGSPVPTPCSAGLGYTRVIIAMFLNVISNDGVRGPRHPIITFGCRPGLGWASWISSRTIQGTLPSPNRRKPMFAVIGFSSDQPKWISGG